MEEVKGKVVTLDCEGDLRTCGAIVQKVTVSDHYLQCRCGGGGEVKKFSNPHLNEIIGTTTIVKDHDAMMRDLAIDMKGFEHQYPRQNTKTNLGVVIKNFFERGHHCG